VRLALRELRRRPGRFAVATAVLGVLAVLLMFLGSLLDGLLARSTGAFRAQDAELIVFSQNAGESLNRSRVEQETRDVIGGLPGVDQVGGLGTVQLGARPGDDPDARDLISVALFGYTVAPAGLPPDPPVDGTVIADSDVIAEGVAEGDVLLLGPRRTPVEVVGFVDDTGYAGQISLWGSLATWQAVTAANRPDRVFAEGSVQALVVQTSATATSLAGAIDAATEGATRTLTIGAAIEALPGVSQQRSTFNQIIAVTAVIALVVVGLFFALITVERAPLYGIFKAIGASSSTLFAGVAAQAVIVALAASLLGVAGSLALDVAIPPGSVPFQVTPSRLLTSSALIVVAALAGSAFSLGRIVRVDPATAIGGAT
jgi:putative ABC transport system permease protein